MLKTTTLQEILELSDNIIWQVSALLRQHILELGPVFLDQQIKKGVLWLMSLVLKRADRPDIVLESV